LGIFLPVLLLAVAGCGRSGRAVDEAYARRALYLANGAEPSTLDPHLNNGVPEGIILNELYEPLLKLGDDGRTLIPGIAASWDISADGRTYTFHLRRDMRWSNGDPVTAGDFLGSFRRVVDPQLAGPFAARANCVVGVADFLQGRITDPARLGFSAPDDQTFVVTLTAPNIVFLRLLADYPWVPVHLATLDATGGRSRSNQSWLKPGVLVTNGPMQLAEWVPDVRIVLTPNPHYPDRAKVWLHTITFFPIDSINAEELAFRAGQIHATTAVPSTKIAAYQAGHNPALRITPRLGITTFIFNTRRPPFDDARVRRAFSLAIGRDELVQAAYQGGYTPARSLSQPGMGGYEPTVLLTGGPAEARRLLAEAGYPGGAGFPRVTYEYNTLDRNRTVAEILQQMWWKELGIHVELMNEEWKVYLDSLHSGRFSLIRSGWAPFVNDPVDYYELFVTNAPNNYTGWGDRRFDAFYEQALQTQDATSRYALYREMDTIIRDEAPVAPLVFNCTIRLVDPRVRHWPNNVLDARQLSAVTLDAGAEP